MTDNMKVEDAPCEWPDPIGSSTCDDRFHETEQDDMNLNKPRKLRSKEPRHCTVCGDRALGFNFDAVTCESCKAFFRRNANKVKQPKCMFRNACVIDAHTRRFCSACRLTKCFDVGMKKEMILGEDERQKRIEKVKQNRAKKLRQGLPDNYENNNEVSSTAQTSAVSPTQSTNGSTDSGIKIKVDVDASPSYGQQRDPSTTATSEEVNSQTSDEVSTSLDATPSHRQLTVSEESLIAYIDQAYKVTLGSAPCDDGRLHPDPTTLQSVMNNLGTLVRLLISFAKKLSDFVDLPQVAQVSLLKGSLLDCICWRSAQFLSLDSGHWVTPEGRQCSVQVLGSAFGHVDPTVQQDYINIFTHIRQLLGDDKTVISLIQCVVFLSPEYSADGYRGLTSNMQDKYFRLLKHYLESKHDWADAFNLLSKLMLNMCRVREYTAKHSRAIHHCDTTSIEPLLIEVFNIKTPSTQ